MAQIIGYARVSTQDQDLQSQIDALREAGCHKIYTDKASGAKSARPGLEKCLEEIGPTDTLMVTRLDRLGRTMPHLVKLINDLKARNIAFRSLGDGDLDTSTASGELIFHIFASLAEFERRLIAERTQAGLKAARARGKRGGRPTITADHPSVKTAKRLHADQTISLQEICQTLNISRSTLHRYVKM